jgi:hypothetical protein
MWKMTLLFVVSWCFFVQDVLFAVRKWISRHPQLPDKWAAQILKIGRRAQTKRKQRKDNKKDKTLPADSYVLADGRAWHDGLTGDVLLLFQLLMAEEAKAHPLPEDCSVQLAGEAGGSADAAQSMFHRAGKRAFLPVCPMDRKVICALDVLEHCVFNPTQPSSPFGSPIEGLPDEKNCWSPMMSTEDALKERCGMFLLDVAGVHPALFLRYQTIIHKHLSRSAQSWVALHAKKSNKSHRQSLDDYSYLVHCLAPSTTSAGESDVSEVAALEASGYRIDGTRISRVRFTASFTSIKPYVWEVMFSCYDAMNPLVAYMHVSSAEFGMEECVNLISELADRRMVSVNDMRDTTVTQYLSLQ